MDDLTIRVESAPDYAATDDVLRLAFGRTDEAALVARLREREEYLPGLAFVAEFGDDVVGYLLLIRAWIIPDKRERNAPDAVRSDVLALAPMAVLPKFQRHGIGSALVRHGLEAAVSAGERIVIVLGHPEYYPRFGFRPASAWGVRAPFNVPDEAFMLLNLGAEPLARLDGVVNYAAPFHDM